MGYIINPILGLWKIFLCMWVHNPPALNTQRLSLQQGQGHCDANQLVDGDMLPECDDCVTDGALPSEGSESSDDEGLFEDIVSGMVCTCGASDRAHNKTCPLNPRNLYSGFSGRVLFGPAEADGSHNPVLHVPDDTSLEPPNEPPAKKRKASGSFKAGDYVCIHNKQLGGKHLVCRVVQETGGLYQLCCKRVFLALVTLAVS